MGFRSSLIAARAYDGDITESYIDYNRRDVGATAELAKILLLEYDRHPISLAETKAFSPASIGKAYLREMGITPILQRQPGLLPYVGFAQTAFFGGRTSAHIRKSPVPIVYTDFLSMYPTVNSLMHLWRFVVAREIKVIDHCEEDIRQFLEQITQDRLLKPETWKQLTAFVRLVPDGDILPTRGAYSQASNDWQVAINHLYAGTPDDGLWFSLPDVIGSVLLTGRIPKIVDVFRIEPSSEPLPTLRPVKLRGEIPVDPVKQDFFKVVIEERKRVMSRKDLSPDERERMNKALKVLANATSYGIYAEMNQRQGSKSIDVICHAIDPAPYTCKVQNPETPGEFCFPILASLITGAARLMLALLEKCVADCGGTYAMEDTDSMAIVATKDGGLIPCPGGPLTLADGRQAIKALSWAEVEGIAKQFESLNPYDRTAIPGSVLKIEDCNFDPKSGKQREIWCFAISAKRYALFLKDKSRFELLRKGKNSDDNHWKEHGLGHLLNPMDLDSEDREWTAEVWESIIAESLGTTARPISFAKVPAIGRLTITSPPLLNPLAALNDGKPYAEQIKPFNFLLTAQVNPLGHPVRVNSERFHLIAPYSPDPKQWLRKRWTDQYSGNNYKVTTEPQGNDRQTAWIKTFGDVVEEYAYHPESKCADETGKPADQRTIGLLFRRHARIAEIVPIGKESNRLEDVEAGLVHTIDDVYTTYPDPSRDTWERTIKPALQKITLRVLIRETGLSRKMLINARKGHTRPHPRNQRLITQAVRKYFDGLKV